MTDQTEGRKAWLQYGEMFGGEGTYEQLSLSCPSGIAGHSGQVKGRFFTIPELKELAAAKVEAGAVAMRDRCAGLARMTHKEGADYIATKLEAIPLPTPTLAALIAQERSAERGKVLEEAIKVVEECDLIMIIPSTSASLPDCYAANAQVAVVSAIRALGKVTK